MKVDIPHALVTAVIIFLAVFALEHSPLLKGASKGKRILITGLTLFVILFVFNLLWPYGS